jgi:hypothetical protein
MCSPQLESRSGEGLQGEHVLGLDVLYVRVSPTPVEKPLVLGQGCPHPTSGATTRAR